MNRDMHAALGHSLYATLELAMLALESSDDPAEFGEQVIKPLSGTLDYVRETLRLGNN